MGTFDGHKTGLSEQVPMSEHGEQVPLSAGSWGSSNQHYFGRHRNAFRLEFDPYEILCSEHKKPGEFFIGKGIIMKVDEDTSLREAIKFSGKGKLGNKRMNVSQKISGDGDVYVPFIDEKATSQYCFYGCVHVGAPNGELDDQAKLVMVEYIKPMKMVK